MPQHPYSVQYVTIHKFIDGVMVRDEGKFEVATACGNIHWNTTITLAYLYLFGMKCKGAYYVDVALPFGLRSAPFIFTFISDMVEWTLTHNHGVDYLRHYLNDFLTLGPPASDASLTNLATRLQL